MVLLGLYFSAEYDTGSGSMIAFIAALGFMLVALTKYAIGFIVKPKENLEQIFFGNLETHQKLSFFLNELCKDYTVLIPDFKHGCELE